MLYYTHVWLGSTHRGLASKVPELLLRLLATGSRVYETVATTNGEALWVARGLEYTPLARAGASGGARTQPVLGGGGRLTSHSEPDG